MQLTTLDVLIIIALNQKHSITLSKTTFNTHSQFVKNSTLFECSFSDGDTVIIRYKDLRLFRLLIVGYWKKYEQDELLPFEENGFSALRLAKHAKLFAGMLYNSKAVEWNLEMDRCYIHGEQQSGNGLRWAWDWFAVTQIASRECHIRQDLFNPQLVFSSSTHTVSCFFNARYYKHSPAFANKMYLALAQRIDREIKWGPLQLVEKSLTCIFCKFPKIPLHLTPHAQKLVWLCAGTPDDMFPIPLSLAYQYVTGRTKPQKNSTRTSQNAASTIERKQKALENARNNYWIAVCNLNKQYPIKEAPYISVDKKGVNTYMKSL